MTKVLELCQHAASLARALGWMHQATDVYDPDGGLTFCLRWNRPQLSKPRQLHIRTSISGPPTLDRALRKRYVDVKSYGDHVPEINVSAKKAPERIAREIKSRLIPHASELWEALKERADARANYDADCQKVRDAILKHLPAASLIGSTKETICLNTFHPDHIYAEMTPEGDSVSFHRLSIPAELAVQFAELIHRYCEDQADG